MTFWTIAAGFLCPWDFSGKNILVHVCVCVFFFIHLAVYRHLGCFHTLIIMNNATLNMRGKISLLLSYFTTSGDSQNGIIGSYGGVIFNFLRNHQTSTKWLHQFILPLTLYKCFFFCTFASTLVICYVFDK